MKTKKIVALLAVTATAFAGTLGACAEGGKVVTLSGSTSVQPLMLKLEEAFENANPDVDIQVSGGGSGKGITDAQNGAVDFGMASRAVKASETGISYATIALDGIALVVNPACGVENVTSEEVFNLYAYGTAIQNTLTGAIARGVTSGTRGAFDELIKGTVNGESVELGDLSLADGVREFESGGLVLTEIAKSTSLNLIGYVSLGAVNSTVKAVKFNGVEATVENVKAGAYALSRPFNIVWKEGKTLSEEAQKFYDFIMSEEGQTIVASEGYIQIS